MIQVTASIAIDEDEIVEAFVRASGPGGQKVNKTSSAVELRFDVRGSPNLPEPVKARLERLAGSRLTGDGVLVIFAQRFRTQETVERAHLDEKEMQFLYFDGEHATFMDNESYEQIAVDRELIGEPADFLREGMVCTIQLHESTPMSVTLPQTVVMEVVEADPVVKGQTASSSYKPGKLENGRRVMLPPHIGAGTRVVVNTSDGSYLERAKD